ncbi:hypothetical protein BKA82DRAFT_4017195 [Pisolithus tinctorius]|nr:hypothetical protein BKA82DRAFT_4017195 [Pisolithus tinctorius]
MSSFVPDLEPYDTAPQIQRNSMTWITALCRSVFKFTSSIRGHLHLFKLVAVSRSLNFSLTVNLKLSLVTQSSGLCLQCEDLSLSDHLWPEWKTALSPSKTNVTNHKWLDIVKCQYNYHWLGLHMPCVMPTPTPPTQEIEMPMSNKGKQKVTKAEVEQMIVESSHRMEVDNEGEDEVPEKEDDEEEPAQGRQKHKAATKTRSH